ncbi:DUF4112 domain-containing protein [Porphyrobacter algicida]|uniref:DUF4112 domain-containing protein n=1 Tax=Qipengyuania algicida TaxID=1836209 RepID=A0A845AL86_9SPHN|nr:DUF4112 domain-containing protein [Qipengyuania algicida]MXP27788.1 DUF4112 domain-containing protein [Qipengyuania algicida]
MEQESFRERRQAQAMGIDLPLGNSPADIRRRMEAIEFLLERSIQIPGTKYAIGLDAVIGLLPVVGDLIAAAMGSFIIWEAKRLGLPRWKLWRMVGNIALDTTLGAVPLAGDAFDLLFRSNSRNLRIVKRHLDKHHPETQIIEG